MDSIISHLENNVKTPAAIWQFPAEGRELHLSELNTLSVRYAMVLHKLGVQSGDRVGLLLKHSVDYVGLLLAIWRLNAVAVSLCLEECEQERDDQYILDCDNACDFSLVIFADWGDEDAFCYWHNNREKFAIPVTNLQEIKTTPMNDAVFNYRRAKQEDVSILFCASGSNDEPVKLTITHEMMMTQLSNTAYNPEESHHGSTLEHSPAWLPANYYIELLLSVLVPVYTGCSSIVTPRHYYTGSQVGGFNQLPGELHIEQEEFVNAVAV